ncbi:mannose-6-phosphate isomerase [Pedobacter psychrophilus]|uniref:Mannose-6-phosphate isomerase n=1 Tax=Pedobacter psychrophilus TaxID=1826909 RepID=A0A179DHH2_9SPHI|nr:class I mannose-6-phosphate isomerase [Pedobacter psychrophilus]OAQ40344.1 mannose-6-phosphate isomerase [Pedobacter psychrophilus]
MNHLKFKSNYNKRPSISVNANDGECVSGWDAIKNKLAIKTESGKKNIIVVDCYTGVYDDELISNFKNIVDPSHIFLSSDAMKSAEEIDKMVYPDVTDDEVFGYLTRLHLQDFFDAKKLAEIKCKINDVKDRNILLYGVGAALLSKADVLIYADMPRWEGQLRYRRNEVSNLGANNKELKGSLQYKRAYFVDWRVCDRHKKSIIDKWDFVLDSVTPNEPKIVEAQVYRDALKNLVNQPFRVVPFFDPGPWGGQWMKEVCDLDRSEKNFAWCFDCVPEENSLLFKFGDIEFETPSINLVFYQPEQLLGSSVYGRFGDEFPIRFDFLDTIEGGNLSLQVHPTTEYAQEHFGIPYTQEESYYILDADDEATVYLGFKQDVDADKMIKDLQEAKESGQFDAENYAAKWPVKKHDHILIPPGTIHCSGKGAMVLEISATPYIFTFKLWDWGRLGLDGKPRPINVERGEKVLNWNQIPEKTEKELINCFEQLAEGEGWIEERTGLHQKEFIETRRHWFSKKVHHHTHGNLNVLNLVEGREAIIESPSKSFEPFIVHYAETFIIPAQVGEYTITPYGESTGQTCATMKAFVRTQP